MTGGCAASPGNRDLFSSSIRDNVQFDCISRNAGGFAKSPEAGSRSENMLYPLSPDNRLGGDPALASSPGILLFPPLLTLAISLPLLVACAIALWWIGAYFRSISYRFTTSAIIWERGVWFRRSGTIPYRRITAVTVTKGPLSRFLGISRITVQTDTASAPDLHIDGIREPESRMLSGMYHEDAYTEEKASGCLTEENTIP